MSAGNVTALQDLQRSQQLAARPGFAPSFEAQRGKASMVGCRR